MTDTADDADLDDVDEPDDGDEPNGDAAAQTVSRSRRRLAASIARWEGRATVAETELATLRQQNASLQAQVGSVSQLRTSLLQIAVRSQATSMVAPEALEDTVRLLQVQDIVVSVDGKIDLEKVKARVDEFVKARPHLAPRVGRTARSLPGGHSPFAANGHSGTHEEINDLLRTALHDRL